MTSEESWSRGPGDITEADLKFIALNSKLNMRSVRARARATLTTLPYDCLPGRRDLCSPAWPVVGLTGRTLARWLVSAIPQSVGWPISLTSLTVSPSLDIERLSGHVFKVFDPERSGEINFRRFMLVVLALSSEETAEENAEKIFYLVDRNNDGFISVEEYKAVTHDIFLLANEKKISTSNKNQLMKSSFGDMDLNMDGCELKLII